MDHGLPDPKRARTEAWANGDDRRALPPLSRPPPSHQYPPPPPPPAPSPFSRPQPSNAPPPPPPPPQHQLDDRRHERGFGPPQQEPQRTMSMSHSQYPSYSPREAMVKRDPSSPSTQYQQHPRPNSTGHSVEYAANVPPHHDDQRRPSMPPYDAPPPQPYHSAPQYQLPMGGPTFNPSYDHAPAYGPPPTPGPLRDQMYGAAYAESAAGVRRKAPRTSQACKQCRQAKAKCDDPKPCTKCKKEGLECDYTPPEPKQGDKVMTEIMDYMKSCDHRYEKLGHRYEKLENKLDRLITKIAPEIHESLPITEGSGKDEEEEEKPAVFYDMQTPTATNSHNVVRQENSAQFTYDGPISDGPDSPGGDEEAERQPFPRTEPAIPADHTTPAHRMLKWASISKYVTEIMKDPKIKNIYYPINREVKRGVIRLYSRGEGSGRVPYIDKESTSTDHPVSVVDSASTPEASASPDTLSDWGYLNDFSTSGENHVLLRHVPERSGGLNASGMDLEVDENTVRRLAGVYMKHINNMHPIISRGAMESLIRQFLKDVPDSKVGTKSSQYPVAGFTGSDTVPSKRKRSVEPPDSPIVVPTRARWARRSINTALMLMVLALGKICEHTGPIPDVVSENEPQPAGTAFRNGYPSPSNASPVVSPQAPPNPSPKDGEIRTPVRRGSTGGPLQPRRLQAILRNRDIIPGLAYFAEATNIIGNQLGGNTIQHVYVNLLGGLYHGQLARIVESHAYIYEANRALFVLLRPKFDTLRQMTNNSIRKSKEHNQLLVAFWTGLQLETDILAELDLPQSEITRWGNYMPFPDILTLKDVHGDDTTCLSYIAQLWMRRHLNELHSRIYNFPEDTFSLSLAKEHPAYISCSEMEWILPQLNTVAGPMFWDTNEPPPKDILHARLRAKYHGAEVLTYRPFLKMVLDRPKGSFSDPAANTKTPDGINIDILNFAERCIRAMEKSTTAFEGMKGSGRLIVTNVWGTAHAQWGNCIVLLACYTDEILSKFVDPSKLKGYIRQIIGFLRSVAQPSSALMQDLRILGHMARSTGLMNSQELKDIGVHDDLLTTSFSSAAST